MSAFDLEAGLAERKDHHLYRYRHVLETAQGPIVNIDGHAYLNFCSNDYLGLANHSEVIKAFQEAANTYGVGGGASHVVIGHSKYHHALEEALAEFTGRPKALLFSSGFLANMGTINALIGKQDAVFEDRLNHASLLDAGLLSGARFQRYLHCDIKSANKKLSSSSAKRKLLVTDGVFSMDGDKAPLSALVSIAKQYGAWLMVDDAHGLGVLGKSGGGSLEEKNLSVNDVPILMGTLGKALGTMGAFVAGNEALIETLIQLARTYIFTTALPPAVAAASLVSLDIAKKESWRREKLKSLINQFKHGCSQLGINLMPSNTAIQPIIIGCAYQALAFHHMLKIKNVLVNAIRPPTVPKKTSRLRITFSASHTEQQVNQLLDAISYASSRVDKTGANL